VPDAGDRAAWPSVQYQRADSAHGRPTTFTLNRARRGVLAVVV
jgi:hypothetical protein